MEKLITDGEAGLNTERVKQKLASAGIKLVTRAPEQHASMAEMAGSMLRLMIHLINSQLKKENITISMKTMTMQALFALNALTPVGSATPYQVVFCRQPAMLPTLQGSDQATDSADGRFEQRVREITINSMVQASALNQTRRALHRQVPCHALPMPFS